LISLNLNSVCNLNIFLGGGPVHAGGFSMAPLESDLESLPTADLNLQEAQAGHNLCIEKIKNVHMSQMNDKK